MTRRRLLAVPALVAAALVAQAGLAVPAQAAGARYAAPTGSGTACSSTAPCSLVTAVNSAPASTEVVVLPGSYDTGATGLVNRQAGVNVHGLAGQPRPAINSAAGTGLELTGSGARVSDLAINHLGGGIGLNVFTTGFTVQRVEVHSGAPVACFFGYAGLARDSTCTTSAPNGVAVDDEWGGNGTMTAGTVTLRNITAVATGTSSFGLRAATSDDYANLDVNARNVVVSGTRADVYAARSAGSSDSDVVLNSSNYDVTSVTGSGATVTAAGTGTNQKTPPVWADAAYHQAPSSPTVDHGTSDASVGPLDVDGETRQAGAAVDIGADEYVPDTTAPDTAFDHTPKRKTHKHKAVFSFHASEPSTFTCVLDKKPAFACGSPVKVKVKKRGKHTFSVVARDASGNTDASPATCTWKVKKKKKRHRHHAQHHRAG